MEGNDTKLLNDNPFVNMSTSSFALAIGTGLALESMFEPRLPRYDDKREIPNKVNLNEYSYHIWNLYTIIRNILTAVQDEKDKVYLLGNKYLKDKILEEVDNLFLLYQGLKMQPVIYIPSYGNRIKRYNKEKLTPPTKTMLETTAIGMAVKNLKLNEELKIYNLIEKEDKIPMISEGKLLVTTHIAMDLLDLNSRCMLLEAHTGKLRARWEWYNKYHPIGTKELSMMPFLPELLYILGDMTLVSPMKLTTRLELYQLAVDRRWTSRLTKDRVVDDLRRNSSLYAAMDMFRSNY